jgi:hypothetical protein
VGRGIFAAWTGELAFFTIVGLVVAVVSLREPEQETFLQRVKILYGMPDSPQFALEYNSSEIKKLAAYATRAERMITIEEYSQESAGYRIRTRTHYSVKNMLRDVVYTDVVVVSVGNDPFDHPPRDLGRLRSVKIGNVEQLAGPETIPPEGYKTSFPISIGPGGTSDIVVEYTTWCRIGEDQEMIPQRLVELFSMEIVSEVAQTVNLDLGPPVGVVSLAYRVPMKFPDVRAVSPQTALFRYKFLAPH